MSGIVWELRNRSIHHGSKTIDPRNETEMEIRGGKMEGVAPTCPLPGSLSQLRVGRLGCGSIAPPWVGVIAMDGIRPNLIARLTTGRHSLFQAQLDLQTYRNGAATTNVRHLASCGR